ncbi:hypothetical protein TNCV_3847372 [Trichonephila clavipes]|nr:hypothetical protein TNCV_3847372 [Trichonephila clavipes]
MTNVEFHSLRSGMQNIGCEDGIREAWLRASWLGFVSDLDLAERMLSGWSKVEVNIASDWLSEGDIKY